MSQTVKTLVFDLDGTLVDSARDLVPCLNRIIALDGVAPVTLEQVGKIVGQGAYQMIKQAYKLGQTPLAESRHQELLTLFLQEYEAHIACHTVYYDGVFAALDHLAKSDWQFAICTNKYQHLAQSLVDQLGGGSYFKALTGGDTFPFKKPDPRHIIETIHQAGGDTAHAIMVGDSINDIQAAKAGNIPAIVVDFGYTDIAVETMQADRIISHFNALPETVSSLLSVT